MSIVPLIVALLLVSITSFVVGRTADALDSDTPQAEAAVGTAFTYQGQLTNDGAPVNDLCNFTFELMDAVSGGNTLATVNKSGVSVSDGLFTVELDFGASAFNGQARWLQTSVDCGAGVETLSPRQPLTPVPYATGLVPGATISASISADEHLLHARSGATTADEGVLGAKVGYRTGLDYPVGVYAYAKEFGSIGVWGVSDSQFGWGVNGVAEGTESIGVRGVANAFNSITYGVYGEASSPDGFAGYFDHTASTGEGVALAANGPAGAVITGTDGTGLSVSASGSTGGDDGERGEHTGGDGVVGFSDGTGDLDNGVIGFTDGGYGVYGFSNAAGQYAGYFDGPVRATSCTGCTLSYIARNTSDSTLRTGALVQTEGVESQLRGAQQPVMQVAAAATNEQILGVVVGRTEMTMVEPGADDARPGPHYGPVGGAARPGDYLVVAVQGMAQVRLDAATRIRAGDRIGLSVDGTAQAIDTSSFGMALEQPDENGLAWVLIGFD